MYAKLLLLSAIVVVFLVLGALFVFGKFPSGPAPRAERMKLELRGVTLDVEIARTVSQKARGLSGRAPLPDGTGMLFWYEKPGMYSFWMSGMRFPLDFIWFDGDWNVIDVTERVAPESFPKTFSARKPSQYILEVPAGFVAAHGISIGDAARLPL